MTDIVNIIAGNSYSTNGLIINVYDSTIAFPGLAVGAAAVPIVASLMDAGFVLFEYTGDGNVVTYMLIRNGDVVTCNPLRAFEGRLGTVVTVTTAAGTESGILILIGENVVELLENTGDILLIPAYSIESVI